MIISGTSNANSYYYQTINKTESDNNNSFEIDVVSTTIEDEKKDIWEELGNQYDIRNATFEELREIGKKLHEAGEISAIELFHFDADFSVAKGDNLLCTPREGGKHDWIENFENLAHRNLRDGCMTGYNLYINCTKILSKIESSGSE